MVSTMPVFRVEKNSNYTTMCNYHLRDQGLSLKGKGLLSMLLSLPDTWNYSVRGLSSITPDGVDGVLTALKELERLGYLERNQQRESNGRMGRAEYVIYEMPRKKPCSESPCTEKPYTVRHGLGTAAGTVFADICGSGHDAGIVGYYLCYRVWPNGGNISHTRSQVQTRLQSIFEAQYELKLEEDKTVMIAYATMYGNTENAANVLAGMLADKGVKNIAMYDVSETDVSELVAESFRCSHLVLAAPTYNSGIQPKMEAYLSDIKALNLQNRTVAVIDNGTWAATAGKQMIGMLEGMKNMTILENTVSIKSALAENQLGALEALADELAKQVNG